MVATRSDGDPAAGFDPATTSYDDPLVAPGELGAAGRAIDCVHPPVGENRQTEFFSQGATSGSPRQAVETAYSEGLFISAPDVDLAVAASQPDRQLLTYEVDGTVLMALVVRDGPAAKNAGGPGWYLESWARCDFAEFPPETAATGLTRYQAWSDADGAPVPVAEVYSAPGPEHCSWEGMTFLFIGDDRSYVEDPEPDLRDVVAGPYRTGIPLPTGARDTDWERDGRHLWLSPGGSYAYVGSEESVDAWPRFESGCA